MFDIGLQELVIIFLVALLVFGPDKLPGVGKTLGKWLFELRRGVENVRDQVTSELSENEKTLRAPEPLQKHDSAEPPEPHTDEGKEKNG